MAANRKNSMQTELIQPSESAVRQKAKRRLWCLVRTNQNSRGYHERGKVALADKQNVVRHSGLSLAEASRMLDSIPLARRGVDYL